MQPDIFDLLRVDRRERLGHAVDERLAADEADARIAKRLRDQVLGSAEADLEADVIDRSWKQRGEIACGRGQIHREPRQQRFEQSGLVRAQGVSLAPAEECAVMVGLVVGHGALRRRRHSTSRLRGRSARSAGRG